MSDFLPPPTVHALTDALTEDTTYIDLDKVAPFLQSGQVALIDPQYFIELGSRGLPISRRQDLPREAFATRSNFDAVAIKDAQIISISYCWLSRAHPDPECYHLNLLAVALRCFSKGSFEVAKEEYDLAGDLCKPKSSLQKDGYCFGSVGASSAAVFFDFGSLHQKDRNDEEEVLFKDALKGINIWYAHSKIIVWMFTTVPGIVENDYDSRGWPTFERAISMLIKPSHFLLEFGQSVREAILQEASKYESGDYVQLTLDSMSRSRPPPMVPAVFNELIDHKIFTNGADADEIAKPKYDQTFHAVIAGAKNIFVHC